MLQRQDITFPTLDGIQLAGTLYLAEGTNEPTPGVVMAPGFNCTKDMFVPEMATAFQSQGLTTLVFDHRTIGLSEGQPRNDINPAAHISDYSDALTYLLSLDHIDENRLILWGFSFSGALALCAGALDPRACCIIAFCPFVDLACRNLPAVLEHCAQDRESRILEGNKPVYLPLLTEEGENPAGFGVGLAKEHYQLVLRAKKTVAPTFENQTTVMSYYRLAMWQPEPLWKMISEDMPVLWVIPELDNLSPAALQKQRFEELRSRHKESFTVKGRGHMDVLSGEASQDVVQTQIEFVGKHSRKT